MHKYTLLSILLLIVFSLLVFFVMHRYFAEIELWVAQLGFIGMLVCLSLYFLIAFTPFPSDPISILVMAVYAPLHTFIIIWIGNCLIALVEYQLGDHFNRHINYLDKIKRLPLGIGKLPVGSRRMLLIGRAISGYGNKLISLLAGAHKVPLKRYMWTTIVSNLWGAMVLTIGGHTLKNLIKLILVMLS